MTWWLAVFMPILKRIGRENELLVNFFLLEFFPHLISMIWISSRRAFFQLVAQNPFHGNIALLYRWCHISKTVQSKLSNDGAITLARFVKIGNNHQYFCVFFHKLSWRLTSFIAFSNCDIALLRIQMLHFGYLHSLPFSNDFLLMKIESYTTIMVWC